MPLKDAHTTFSRNSVSFVNEMLPKHLLVVIMQVFNASLARKPSSVYQLCLQTCEFTVRTWSKYHSFEGGILVLHFIS